MLGAQAAVSSLMPPATGRRQPQPLSQAVQRYADQAESNFSLQSKKKKTTKIQNLP